MIFFSRVRWLKYDAVNPSGISPGLKTAEADHPPSVPNTTRGGWNGEEHHSVLGKPFTNIDNTIEWKPGADLVDDITCNIKPDRGYGKAAELNVNTATPVPLTKI